MPVGTADELGEEVAVFVGEEGELEVALQEVEEFGGICKPEGQGTCNVAVFLNGSFDIGGNIL